MQTDVVHDIEDARELQALYETHWWFEGRSLEDIRRSLAESDEVFGVRNRTDGTLIASCRVLTDYTFTGKIQDVIVADSHRREGVGAELLRAVTSHSSLAAVDELTLTCRESVAPFYQQLGFEIHEMIQQNRSNEDQEDYFVMVYR